MFYFLASPRQTIRGLRLLRAHPGFAPTQVLPDTAGGRPASATAPLSLFSCGCGKDHLLRICRDWWMRLLPAFRLYSCRACGKRVLRPRMRARPGYGSVYLRATPVKWNTASLSKALPGVLRRLGAPEAAPAKDAHAPSAQILRQLALRHSPRER